MKNFPNSTREEEMFIFFVNDWPIYLIFPHESQ